MAKSSAKKRFVIKLGTRVLTQDDGSLSETRIKEFLEAISKFRDGKNEFVLVSSGAVGLGRKELGLTKNLELSEKQACAAVGQVRLMETYRRIAHQYNIPVAQVLLTHTDFADRNKYLNLRESLEKLLELNVLPILNENDPVSVEEIRELSKDKSFGDNDRLSAIIASKLDADWLIMLTDVDGVFTENPKQNPKATVVREIEDVKKFSGKTQGKSDVGRGGMSSKLEAAQTAALAGVSSIIASGKTEGILEALLKDPTAHGTAVRGKKGISSRRKWIGLSSGYAGVVVINAGAQQALEEKGASLLPAGVVKILGEFDKGEVVKVQNENGEEVARGIVAVSSRVGQKILGKKSSEIKKLITDMKIEDFIHRDNMVIFGEGQSDE